MAYKSQITSKYMGATFKGAPKSNTVTELGQIVDALRQDLNPALNKFASAKVDKQQSEAAIKVQGLYASGKSAEEIATEIENGLHPDLEHKYTAAVVDGYFGKFEAAKSIKQIEKALEAGDYDFTTDSLETFSIYGQVSSSSGAQYEAARTLVQFPIGVISSDRTAATIPASGSVNFFLYLYNVRTDQTLPRGFTLVVSPEEIVG